MQSINNDVAAFVKTSSTGMRITDEKGTVLVEPGEEREIEIETKRGMKMWIRS